MIIENSGVKGLKSDLAHLDEVAEGLGFVRWQWEYYRATYDYKLQSGSEEYFLRVNARVESGKLESAYAVLVLDDVYIGKTSFPHGLDYEAAVPADVLQGAKSKLAELQQALTD
ncbi:YugN family protein [Gorillibacterium sp. sgz5001074]|uniref:YugN family protein n=1 Tax=Gorillibacterium sp. sgz5001074 TaxID=3446695 RepID=UPI003F66E1D9